MCAVSPEWRVLWQKFGMWLVNSPYKWLLLSVDYNVRDCNLVYRSINQIITFLGGCPSWTLFPFSTICSVWDWTCSWDDHICRYYVQLGYPPRSVYNILSYLSICSHDSTAHTISCWLVCSKARNSSILGNSLLCRLELQDWNTIVSNVSIYPPQQGHMLSLLPPPHCQYVSRLTIYILYQAEYMLWNS